MSGRRSYRDFQYREAVFRICCERFEAVTDEIVRLRHVLEDYIAGHREFGESFEPVKAGKGAPDVAVRMARAARLAGTGPMAAVAGVMAQLAGEAGIAAGAREAIIENGGDIYIKAAEPVVIGLYSGPGARADRLGFSLQAGDTPVSVCSSSGKMGHSRSLGDCDLATVVAVDAALADAAATQAANMVRAVEDVDAALERISAIDGVDGVLIVKEGRIGLAGKLPKLVRVKG